MRSFVRAAVLGCVVIVMVGAAACGDDDETGNTAAQSNQTATGEEIKLATALPVSGQFFKVPEMEAGMRAALESINAAGGVKGHPLSLEVCDTKFTANGETGCIRELVADKPAALVAPFLVADSSGAAWPIIEEAGIPAIGQQGGTPAEMNSPNAFLLGSAFVGPFAGTAVAIDEVGGAGSVALITDDPNPAGKPIADLITGTLAGRGITKVKPVTGHTESDPTFATAAAQATEGDVDGIILNGSPNTVAAMVKAIRSTGFDGSIATASLLLPPQTIEALGDAANGIILSSSNAYVTDEDNPGVRKFKDDMAKYQPDAVLNDASIQGWSGMMLFAEAAAGATEFDSKSLMAAFEAVDEPIDLGTSGPWSMVGKTGKVPGFSRIVNPTITVGVVEDGEIAPRGDGFTNPLGP